MDAVQYQVAIEEYKEVLRLKNEVIREYKIIAEEMTKAVREGKDNCLWKRRYESLSAHLEDIEYHIRNLKLETSESRDWVPKDIIYVSFSNDVCDTEEYAIKNFGKDNYDVYQIKQRSPKE